MILNINNQIDKKKGNHFCLITQLHNLDFVFLLDF